MTDPKAQLDRALKLIETELSPQDFLVYKPRGGRGAALKLNLRLQPEFEQTADGGQYIRRTKQQGLFLELAPEGPKSDAGYATFLWRDPERVVRCKLGMPDVTRLLVGIREYRHHYREVPKFMRPGPDVDKSPNVISSFHKFGQANTAITYTFQDEQMSILNVSKQAAKGAEAKRVSIALNLDEEFGFERYLSLALDGFLRVGLR